MSQFLKRRFNQVLSGSECVLAANVFDPLSARIASLLDYEVCFLSGSVGKAASLGVPDLVMTNMSDLVEHCRRITRMGDVALMLDGEDGFGSPVNTIRTVRELEAAGVSAIEIEDNLPRRGFNREDPGLISKAEQVSKLKAAVEGRVDTETVIVARTAALAYCSLDDALERINAYSATGVKAVRLSGLETLSQLQAVNKATHLPLTVLSPPPEVGSNLDFLAANGVRILMAGNAAYAMAVKSIYDCFAHLKNGGVISELSRFEASPDLLKMVTHIDELVALQGKYDL